MFQRYNGWELSEDSDGPFYKKVDVDPKIKQLESANEKLTVDKAVLIEGIERSIDAGFFVQYERWCEILKETLEKVHSK